MEPSPTSATALKSLFDFEAPGPLLRHFFEQEKAHAPALTHAQFAAKLGLSLSLFRMIVGCKRTLTIENIHQIAAGLRLGPAEHEYFEAMVLCHQSQNEFARAHYGRKLTAMRVHRSEARVRYPAKAFTRHWFVPALVVWLIDVHGVQKNGFEGVDAHGLARRFEVSSDDMQDALSDVQKLELFKGLPEGGVSLSLDKLVHAVSTKRYIASVGTEALKRVETHFEDRAALFETCALTLGRVDFEAFVHQFKSLLDAFANVAPGNALDARVYQIFCAAWPVDGA